MIILLDGSQMTSPEALHRHLAETMPLPSHYGANLDALWDVLMEISPTWEIVLLHTEQLLANLPDYGQALLDTFAEAAALRENISFESRP